MNPHVSWTYDQVGIYLSPSLVALSSTLPPKVGNVFLGLDNDGNFKIQDSSNVITPLLTGILSTGRVPYSTAAGSLSNSNIYQAPSNGEVGIGGLFGLGETFSVNGPAGIHGGFTVSATKQYNLAVHSVGGEVFINSNNRFGEGEVFSVASGASFFQSATSDSLSYALRAFNQSHNAYGFNGEIFSVRGDGFVGIGTAAPTASLHIKGLGNTSATTALQVDNLSGLHHFAIQDNGDAYFGEFATTIGNYFTFRTAYNVGFAGGILMTNDIARGAGQNSFKINASYNSGNSATVRFGLVDNTDFETFLNGGPHINLVYNGDILLAQGGTGNVGIGVAPTATLHIHGSGTTSATSNLKVVNNSSTVFLEIKDNGAFTLGLGASTASALSVTIGYSASTTGQENVSIGYNSSAAIYSTVVGASATDNAFSLNTIYGNGNRALSVANIIMGAGNQVTSGARNFVFGQYLDITAVDSLIFGYGTTLILPSASLYIGNANAGGTWLQMYGAGSLRTFEINPFDASGGSLTHSSELLLRAKYWDGAASQNYDFNLSHIMDTVTPDSHIAIKFAGNELARISSNGAWAIGSTAKTAALTVHGTNGYDQLNMPTPFTPTSSADARGHVGDIAWDDDFFYEKVSTGWKRAALSAF